MIFHIAVRGEWAAAQASGAYRPAAFATDGFIHCSTGAQVEAVANDLYGGREDCLLLFIDEGRLRSDIRWEPATDARPGRFPHVYGPLNLDAVVRVVPLVPEPNGRFRLPALP